MFFSIKWFITYIFFWKPIRFVDINILKHICEMCLLIHEKSMQKNVGDFVNRSSHFLHISTPVFGKVISVLNKTYVRMLLELEALFLSK